MICRLQSVALRVAIVCAMALSLMFAPPTGSLSHDPIAVVKAETERHQALSAEIVEHGHAHDDGWNNESHSGHLHGHNAADHLHDTPSDPPAFAMLILASGESWRINTHYDTLPLRVFDLDRPPRA
jgi:hypothetical protein